MIYLRSPGALGTGGVIPPLMSLPPRGVLLGCRGMMPAEGSGIAGVCVTLAAGGWYPPATSVSPL